MKHLRITVEGKSYDVTVEKLDSTDSTPNPAPVVRSAAAAVPLAKPQTAPKAAVAAGDVVSPLAGIVKALEVAVGTAVKAGDVVITLEAMKMFTGINAPTDGIVSAFHVNVGDAVDEDQPLYTLS